MQEKLNKIWKEYLSLTGTDACQFLYSMNSVPYQFFTGIILIYTNAKKRKRFLRKTRVSFHEIELTGTWDFG